MNPLVALAFFIAGMIFAAVIIFTWMFIKGSAEVG